MTNNQPDISPEDHAAAQLWVDTMQKASAVQDCLVGVFVSLGDGGHEGVREARTVFANAAVQLDSQLGKYAQDVEDMERDLQDQQPQPPEDPDAAAQEQEEG